MYIEETNGDMGAMIFAVVVTMLVGVVLLVPSVVGYCILWMGGKFGWWVFDTNAQALNQPGRDPNKHQRHNQASTR